MFFKYSGQGIILFLIASFMAGCVNNQNATPISTAEQLSTALDTSKYAFPESSNPIKRYLFYLHGKIIEDQGIPAVSPDYGEYEYKAILEKLSSYGFIVISEQRAKNTDGMEYAKKITEQITLLLKSGVPANNVTIVGASKGAGIAIEVSHLLENPEVNFVIIGTCHPDTVKSLKQNETFLYGKVLSIYDSADYEYSGSCEELFSFSEANGGLSQHNEIVLNIGTGHGILYKPLDEWIMPIVQWAGIP